ncbi:helix-turn-helix domain-containing protein [Nonomuraea roseoviolacea]|uniref:Transcriptional regulator with XRE-family HTH domain n=1 Tax=Nonomuraea roseoviolacea subsp. carminata TaxID=160689 RepID=A0ABT1K348_9ACTN|nr:helix-turn-helix transcriptional regulator [Nonomuraea roseoviolacea]MCP2348425.1 transcriptional regulator with XRE-family HTH domain [Nonomuraea roseoviolacea subsp. carminata]
MRDIARARQAIGARLKELRLDARLTGRQLAARYGWQPSKISKIESGKQTPSEADIEAWCRAVERPDEQADLIASLRAMETLYAEWRRQLRHGTKAKQQNWLEMEAETKSFRVFEPCVIPGLLQTGEYARQRLAQSIAFYETPNDLEEGVATRLRRQEILYDSSRTFHFVILEAALRLGMAPLDVMFGQLDRLMAASAMPRVRLGVIPMQTVLPFTPLNGFWLLDRRVVLAETYSAELTLTLPKEIKQHERMFDLYAKAAHYGPLARRLIASAIEALSQLAEDSATT